MINKIRTVIVLLLSLIIYACSESADTAGNKSIDVMPTQQERTITRWYNLQQVMKGAVTFQKYCAECHMADASGSPDWRQKDANGKYPPPPLNGTAHAWHHPMDGLRQTVRIGGVPLGGSMPAFSDKLNAQEIDEVLAWVQSKWTDEIYTAWLQRNKTASR